MAGSYPDVPGYRFAYDIDGTVGFRFNSVLVNLSSAEMTLINRENSIGDGNNWIVMMGESGVQFFGLIFPEPRNINGLWMMTRRGGETVFNPTMEWSNDTTNGIDGTWTTGISGFGKMYPPQYSAIPFYRTGISTTNLTNVTAVRFSATLSNYAVMTVHLYGSIPTLNSPNRLRIIDETDDDIAAQLDFGNILQRNSSTRQFKVFNNSATLTANNITVGIDAPTDATPSLVGQYQVSTDNVAFANQVNIGNLSPGQSSGTMYLKDAVADNATLGPWTVRLIAHPVTWS